MMEYNIQYNNNVLIICEEKTQYKVDLQKRLFDFAVRVIKFLKTIRYSQENSVIKNQLAKAATSMGANYEEAQGAYSKDDFKYKIGICFRESKESNYWLRIIKAADIANCDELDELIKESVELKKIFGSIMKKIHHRNYKVKRKK